MAVNSKKLEHFQTELLTWATSNSRTFPWRSPTASQYEKIVSEILLQRTLASTVAKHYRNFFSAFSGWEELAQSTAEEIGKELRSFGLWKIRSKTLKSLAQAIITYRGVPSDRKNIMRLPGVGQYIANAIELLIYKRPKPLLDVNMARVLERYFGPRKLADIRYDPYLQDLAHKVVDTKNPVDINFAILDFAALVCKARNPECETCPLRKNCVYYEAFSNKS